MSRGKHGGDRIEGCLKQSHFSDLPPPCDVTYMASISISLIHMEKERNQSFSSKPNTKCQGE